MKGRRSEFMSPSRVKNNFETVLLTNLASHLAGIMSSGRLNPCESRGGNPGRLATAPSSAAAAPAAAASFAAASSASPSSTGGRSGGATATDSPVSTSIETPGCERIH